MARYRVFYESEDEKVLFRLMAAASSQGIQLSLERVEPALEDRPVEKRPTLPNPLPVEERWDAFVQLLNANQKMVLRIIRQNGSSGPGLTSAQISKMAGAEKANWFTGVFNGGVQRNVEKAHLALPDVVEVLMTAAGPRYRPGRILAIKDIPEE